MAAKRHTHKYHKVPLGSGKVWACARLSENCTHHIPPYMESTIVGRKSICWECNDEFVLDPNSIEHDKPICPDCRGITNVENAVQSKLLESVFNKHQP